MEGNGVRRKFGRYLAEFVVVFLGVWLSLMAEQLREDRADQQRELQALAAIASDLESDSAWVEATILRASQGLGGATRFLEGGLSEADLLEALMDIAICSFTGNQRTSRYEALRTGELGFVQVGELRAQIEGLYFDSSARDYLHARDCDKTERFFQLIAPYSDMEVPPLERENAIDGWGWNDRPVILEIRDGDQLQLDPRLRSHVSLLASERQFLLGWLEREVANRGQVLEAIRRYTGE